VHHLSLYFETEAGGCTPWVLSKLRNQPSKRGDGYSSARLEVTKAKVKKPFIPTLPGGAFWLFHVNTDSL
jgi:hypothetical protein